MAKKPNCKYCGSDRHYSINCFSKPRRPIRGISIKRLTKKQVVDRQWYELNPSSKQGTWTCYLQISELCPVVLTRSTITLEHVKSKVRHPELIFVVTNLRPACSDCNKLKGSLDIEDLVIEHPHLKNVLDEK